MKLRTALTLVLSAWLAIVGAVAATAQGGAASDRFAITGGAQTLEDILARQRGERVDDSFRREAIGNLDAARPSIAPLGTLGGVSDAELWRALRYGEVDLNTTVPGGPGAVVIQDGGMWWLQLRNGPLRIYGGYLLLGVIGLLALFYLIRGRIRLEGTPTGRKVVRFKAIERFAHWLMAGSFILLGLTGLTTLYGRVALIPPIGKEAFAALANASKLIHNWVAWGFIAGLAMVFVLWVAKNFPKRYDLVWMIKAGGLLTRGVHPPAGMFNAGEKIVFWAVMVFGVLISLSGVELLFPFRFELFSHMFKVLNDLGIPQMIGLGPIDTALSPQEEMQFAHLSHVIVAFVFIALVLAHIYIGSIGMEGALEGMTRGTVDVQWAKEHHNIWYEELETQGAPQAEGTPAE